MPSDALIDTTILTDALLKNGASGVAARAALARYANTQLPVYAIKEFKAGPLRYYVWFHNKVASAQTWEDAVGAIPAVWRQHNLMMTSLNALLECSSSVTKRLPLDLAQTFPGMTIGEIQKREAKTWLKALIFRAWRGRRNLTTAVVSPLSCYGESDLKTKPNGTIDCAPTTCSAKDCCLRKSFTAAPKITEQLLDACDQLPAKPETVRRRQILSQLHRNPKRPLTDKDCRNLGDAVFAFQCPSGSVILTTNLTDHNVFGNAVGVSVEAP